MLKQQVHVAGASGLSPRLGGFDAQCPYQAMTCRPFLLETAFRDCREVFSYLRKQKIHPSERWDEPWTEHNFPFAVAGGILRKEVLSLLLQRPCRNKRLCEKILPVSGAS